MLKNNLLIGASLAVIASSTSFAQDNADDRMVIEEIIITATKRAQTLQEVPIAVSVIGESAIEKARILDIRELGSLVPALRVNQLQTSVNTNFIIRGFGNGANNAGIESSVGVFIDGVYRSRSAARIGDLPKLSRIEVLRGPQSTLFGKNASAGVVSIVTAKPQFESEGYIDAGYGNYNSITGKAYYTGPLSDTVAVSVGGGFNKRDGYVEAQPGLEDVNDRNRWNLRGQLLFQPSEETSVRFIADYSTADESCCAVTNFQNEGAAMAIFALGGQLADANDPFAYKAYQNKDGINKVDDYGFSMHIDHDFGNMQLTSISSYRKTDSMYDTDADYGTLDLLEAVRDHTNIKTVTQEIRLASTGADNKVDWMIGGFYFDEDVMENSGLDYGSDLRPYFDLLIGPGTLGLFESLYGHAAGTYFGDQVVTNETFTQKGTAYSLFGTVDFHLTDRLTITGGLNYTQDKKTVTGTTTNNDTWSNIDLVNDLTLLGVPLPSVLFGSAFMENTEVFTGGPGTGGLAPTPANIAFVESLAPGTAAAITAGVDAAIQGLIPTQFQPQFLPFPNIAEDGMSNDDKLTWNVRMAYDMSDNVNVYASASTGFKASSWNLSRDSRPFLADASTLGGGGLLPSNYWPMTARNFGSRSAGPEKATVYEIGLKARFDRGAINIAVFDQTIEGFQSNTFMGTGFFLANAGEQSTKGLEIDANVLVNDNLELTFAGVFLDPIYDSFEGGIDGTSLTGEKPAGIPSTALSLGATYNFEIGDSVDGYIRADWQYESKVQTNEGISTVTGVRQPFRTVDTINLSAGVNMENGVSLQFWVRNLTNDTYITTTFPGVAQAGIINGYISPPRMIGANIRYNF